MVNHCANPQCCKPLHYLREGRIYRFNVLSDATPSAEKSMRKVEHFWLCGVCSEIFMLEQTSEAGVRLSAKTIQHRRSPTPASPTPNVRPTLLAS